MNWEQVESRWTQLKSSVKSRWPKLSHQDLDFIAGKRDLLVGMVQERYVIDRGDAERQVGEWKASLVSLPAENKPLRKIG